MSRRSIIVGDSMGTSQPVIDTKILNNTIYHTSVTEVLRVSSGVDYLEYKNNIVEATLDNRYIYYTGSLTPTNTHSDFTNNS